MAKKKMRPATSPELRENQLVSLAIDLAEKQLLDGTATSQVITHFLKIGSTKEVIEKQILEKQKDLLEAKTEAIKANRNMVELYEDAMNAMKIYKGDGEYD